MHSYIQLTIPIPDINQKEIVIALLDNAGYESFEETETGLHAFIQEENYNKDEVSEILKPFNIGFTSSIIPQQNWNEEWEKNFEPITVENFAGIRASFHPPFTNVTHEIVITPKMSFGTGHHATTWLVMQAMSKIEFANKQVFDFGTGTGILAILAEKIGAASILATDNDDWCIENAKENTTVNNCTKITIAKLDSIPNEQFDIILANINYNIIVQNLQKIAAACKPNTVLLFSGLLITDEENIKNEIIKAGITPLETTTKNGWICIGCKRKID